MFIPIGTDRPPKHPPVAAPLFIGLCVVAAVMNRAGFAEGPNGTSLVERGALDPSNFHLLQLVTYAFLHDPGSEASGSPCSTSLER